MNKTSNPEKKDRLTQVLSGIVVLLFAFIIFLAGGLLHKFLTSRPEPQSSSFVKTIRAQNDVGKGFREIEIDGQRLLMVYGFPNNSLVVLPWPYSTNEHSTQAIP